MQEICETLSELFGLDAESVLFLRKGGSVSYDVKAGKGRFLLKVIPPAFAATARQSADILLYLGGKGFPVPRIVPSRDGAPCADGAFLGEERLFVLTEYLEGRELRPDEDVEAVGALIGRLHTIMRGYHGALQTPGRDFYVDRYLRILEAKQVERSLLGEYRALGDELWARIEGLPRGFCHGDLHIGNILRTPSGGLYVLDLDTASHSFPMYDAALFCCAADFFRLDRNGYARSQKRLAAFLRGYECEACITQREIAAFADLIGVYHFALEATIIELHGLDCVDARFFQNQMDWLREWERQANKEGLP